jgi:hypothetical protein
VKAKVILLCITKARREGRGIVLPMHNLCTRKGLVVSATPQPLYPTRRRPGTHCREGWVGLGTGMVGYGKSFSYWASKSTSSRPATYKTAMCLITCSMHHMTFTPEVLVIFPNSYGSRTKITENVISAIFIVRLDIQYSSSVCFTSLEPNV